MRHVGSNFSLEFQVYSRGRKASCVRIPKAPLEADHCRNWGIETGEETASHGEVERRGVAPTSNEAD
jgi:hypothetical protein